MNYQHITFYEIVQDQSGIRELHELLGPVPVDLLSSETIYRIVNPDIGTKSGFTVNVIVRTAAAHVWLERWERNMDGIRAWPQADETTRLAAFIIEHAETLPPPPLPNEV